MGAELPSAYPCSHCTEEGGSPRGTQALAGPKHRTEAKGHCFPEQFCTDGQTPLPDFRTHGQRIQGEAKVDEDQDSDTAISVSLQFQWGYPGWSATHQLLLVDSSPDRPPSCL